jgi:CHC2-type zinc finger protein
MSDNHQVRTNSCLLFRQDKEGNSLVGKCPLHNEHRGAAFVLFDDVHWKCFGKCEKSGDVIDLEQALGGGTLAEAAERLGAQRVQQLGSRPEAPKEEAGPIISMENPFGLRYRMSCQEISQCVDAATRLARDTSQIEEGGRVAGVETRYRPQSSSRTVAWRRWRRPSVLFVRKRMQTSLAS